LKRKRGKEKEKVGRGKEGELAFQGPNIISPRIAFLKGRKDLAAIREGKREEANAT